MLFSHVLSLIDKNKNENYREQQEHQSIISNKSLLWSPTLTEVVWKIPETKKLV